MDHQFSHYLVPCRVVSVYPNTFDDAAATARLNFTVSLSTCSYSTSFTSFSSSHFVVPKFRNKQPVNGETSQARNLYIRVEAIDQVIGDLMRAKELLSEEE